MYRVKSSTFKGALYRLKNQIVYFTAIQSDLDSVTLAEIGTPHFAKQSHS